MKRLAHATLVVASVLAASACAGGTASRGALQPGQTRTFPHARAGETVVCVGKGGSIRMSVPRQSADANVYRETFDRTLSLSLGLVHGGGVTVSCMAH